MPKMAGQSGQIMLLGITDCAHRLFFRTAIEKQCKFVLAFAARNN